MYFSTSLRGKSYKTIIITCLPGGKLFITHEKRCTCSVLTLLKTALYGADIWVDDMQGVEGGGGKVILQVVPRVEVKTSRFPV